MAKVHLLTAAIPDSAVVVFFRLIYLFNHWVNRRNSMAEFLRSL